MAKFDGEVWAEIVEVRFAFAGKVASVNKKPGEVVKKWQTLATLDNKQLQMELDRQLADFEKTRAEFEIFAKKSTGTSETDKYLKTIEQARLNVSVKDVELAKSKLDQAILMSPVDGTVVSSGGCRIGIFITPSSASFQIMDLASTVFRFKLTTKDIAKFVKPVEVRISFNETKKMVLGVSRFPIPDNRNGYLVDVDLKDTTDLLPGFKGKLELS